MGSHVVHRTKDEGVTWETISPDLTANEPGKQGILPLVSSCRSFTRDGKFIAQICGGKILAEGNLPVPTALVTMVPGGYQPDQGRSADAPPITESAVPALEALRVRLSSYIEPETGDIDISKEPLLIAVGRGIQNRDNIELAENLAGAIGGYEPPPGFGPT